MKTVDRGAAFLDETLPGWAERIDTDTLDLSSTCNCVLGQLYRYEHPRLRKTYTAFERMLDVLGVDWERSRRLGFAIWGNARYSNLTAAWRRKIRERQSA